MRMDRAEPNKDRTRARRVPLVSDHTLLCCIGEGSYGEVWLAQSVVGTYRAVKVVYRDTFGDDRPYNREFLGIQKFEPISRTHPGFVSILHIGKSAAGFFYYVMELADAVDPLGQPMPFEAKLRNGRLFDHEPCRLGQRLVGKELLNEIHRVRSR